MTADDQPAGAIALPPPPPAVQFYIPATSSLAGAPAAHAQARRHLRPVRPLRRHRARRGQPGGTVSPGHALSVRPAAADQRPAAVAAELHGPGQQRAADRRYHQPRLLRRRRAPAAGARHDPRGTREVHLAGARLRAPGGAQLRRARPGDPPDAAVPDRLRRPVRGARPPSREARPHDRDGDRRQGGHLHLSRPRWRPAPHQPAVRA